MTSNSLVPHIRNAKTAICLIQQALQSDIEEFSSENIGKRLPSLSLRVPQRRNLPSDWLLLRQRVRGALPKGKLHFGKSQNNRIRGSLRGVTGAKLRTGRSFANPSGFGP